MNTFWPKKNPAFWPFKGPYDSTKAHNWIQKGPNHCWANIPDRPKPIYFSVSTKCAHLHTFSTKILVHFVSGSPDGIAAGGAGGGAAVLSTFYVLITLTNAPAAVILKLIKLGS